MFTLTKTIDLPYLLPACLGEKDSFIHPEHEILVKPDWDNLFLNTEDGNKTRKNFLFEADKTGISARSTDRRYRHYVHHQHGCIDPVTLSKAISGITNLIRHQRRIQKHKYNGPNSIEILKKKIKNRKMQLLQKPKKPLHKGRHVGIEVEFFSPYDRKKLQEDLITFGLEKNCNLVGDGSLVWDREYDGDGESEEDMFAHELRIISSERRLNKLKIVLSKFFEKALAEINKSCGLHVHLDARTRDVKRMFKNLVACQPILYGMNGPSRLTSSYCKPELLTTDVFNLEGDRYYGINKESYFKHKTIEVRIGGGSTNVEKIFNWVDLLTRIADKPGDALKDYLFYPSQLINNLYLPSNLQKEVMERWTKNSKGRIETIFNSFGISKERYLNQLIRPISNEEQEIA